MVARHVETEKRHPPAKGKQAIRLQPFAIRLTPEALACYKQAAERVGMSVSEWARLVLDSASGSSELPEQLARVVIYQPREVRQGKW